jgi:hypothetical protein
MRAVTIKLAGIVPCVALKSATKVSIECARHVVLDVAHGSGSKTAVKSCAPIKAISNEGLSISNSWISKEKLFVTLTNKVFVCFFVRSSYCSSVAIASANCVCALLQGRFFQKCRIVIIFDVSRGNNENFSPWYWDKKQGWLLE